MVGAGEEAWVARLNEWGGSMEASLKMLNGAFSTLRDEVLGTQNVLGVTIQEAKVALDTMHNDFRGALGASATDQRRDIEALIGHARVKFVELEVKLDVLNSSVAHAMSVTEQWALGEGARTAAQVTATLGTPPASPRDAWAQHDPWSAASTFGPARMQRGGGAGFQPRPGSQAAPQMMQPPGMQQPASKPAQQVPWLSGPAPLLAQQAPWTSGGRDGPREFRIDSRGWHAKVLDAGVSPDVFQVWRERALAHLSQGRQDIRRLLVWAESKTALDLDAGTASKAQELGFADFPQVDFTLHSAITLTLSDSLLGRARGCEERGLLLLAQPLR